MNAITTDQDALAELGAAAREFRAAQVRFEKAKNDMEQRLAKAEQREPERFFLVIYFESTTARKPVRPFNA